MHVKNFNNYNKFDRIYYNEKPLDKCKLKFKIVSLKVKGQVEYVPELVNPLSISPVRLIMDVILDCGALLIFC